MSLCTRGLSTPVTKAVPAGARCDAVFVKSPCSAPRESAGTRRAWQSAARAADCLEQRVLGRCRRRGALARALRAGIARATPRCPVPRARRAFCPNDFPLISCTLGALLP